LVPAPWPWEPVWLQSYLLEALLLLASRQFWPFDTQMRKLRNLNSAYHRLLVRVAIVSTSERALADKLASQKSFDEAIIDFPLYGEMRALRLVGYFCLRISAHLERYRDHEDGLLRHFIGALKMLGERELDDLDNSKPTPGGNSGLFRRQAPTVLALLDIVPQEWLAEGAWLAVDARVAWS
jgi:hypothetical protein